MSLLSLKKYLNSPEDLLVMRRVISLLLHGMALHAIEIDKTQYDDHRSCLDHLQSSITEQASGQELLVVAGQAMQALADYSRNTTRLIRQQAAVSQNMISMLTQTLISVGAGSEASAQRLQNIEGQLTQAVMIDDLRQVKSSLNDCLTEVRQAAIKQKSEAQGLISQLQKEVEQAKQELDPSSATDSVTGLPAQAAALATLDETLQSPKFYFVAVVVFNRLQSINARFGHEAGDLAFRKISERFSSQLLSGDKVFRWRGPAVIAVLHRERPVQWVQTDIRKICQGFTEETLEVGKRRVMVPVSASWMVIPLDVSRAHIVKSIDNFVANQTQENPVGASTDQSQASKFREAKSGTEIADRALALTVQGSGQTSSVN